MGAKGQRRREKNYQAAHGGGNTRLPPPPDPSSLDAMPSKLRKLMSMAGSMKQPFNRGKKNAENAVDKGEGNDSTTAGMKRKRNDQSEPVQHSEHGDQVPQTGMHEKKKKKRKGKKVEDLRFGKLGDPTAAVSQRKERKKQLLQARKKKNKRPSTEEDVEFRGREEIKFGDVVLAPPKLTAVPKGLKTTQDASQERLRLQAVDAYRKRKGWASRPGVKLPSPMTTSTFF